MKNKWCIIGDSFRRGMLRIILSKQTQNENIQPAKYSVNVKFVKNVKSVPLQQNFESRFSPFESARHHQVGRQEREVLGAKARGAP